MTIVLDRQDELRKELIGTKSLIPSFGRSQNCEKSGACFGGELWPRGDYLGQLGTELLRIL